MPAVPFTAEVGGSSELATIELHGDVNLAAEAGLEAAYEAASGLEARVVLLDFTGADYINSTGIALIVRLLAGARRDGREVRACGLTPHYTEIFEITRLSDYMQIFADRAGASAAPPATTSGGVR
jgi:anti-sigma B factor antagonist